MTCVKHTHTYARTQTHKRTHRLSHTHQPHLLPHSPSYSRDNILSTLSSFLSDQMCCRLIPLLFHFFTSRSERGGGWGKRLKDILNVLILANVWLLFFFFFSRTLSCIRHLQTPAQPRCGDLLPPVSLNRSYFPVSESRAHCALNYFDRLLMMVPPVRFSPLPSKIRWTGREFFPLVSTGCTVKMVYRVSSETG